MYVTTNSTLTWKREADERMQSVRMLARMCLFMFVLLIGAGAYAYSIEARYQRLCTTIELKTQQQATPDARDFGTGISSVYCS